jgi:hypothetical protein
MNILYVVKKNYDNLVKAFIQTLSDFNQKNKHCSHDLLCFPGTREHPSIFAACWNPPRIADCDQGMIHCHGL